MFSLRSLFRPAPEVDIAHELYAKSVLAARRPAYFTAWGVPDTPTGRFEVLALMAFLVLRRLKSVDGAHALAQAYFDIMFDDLDSNLRELGVGDISVGKKVKRLAESFYGRIKAYEDGLAAVGDGVLHDALRRNLFNGQSPDAAALSSVADHMRREAAHLDSIADARWLCADVDFAVISGTEEGTE